MNNLEIFKQKIELNKKKIFLLEVGCNVGLVTKSLSEVKNLKILSIDDNKQHLKSAKKNLRLKKNVKFREINFFYINNNLKYDIILLREFFNIFNYKKNCEIIKKADKILNKGGFIILIDFYSSVIERSKLIRFLKKSNKNIKNHKKFLKSEKDYSKYFNKNKWEITIVNKDLLNQHISFKSRLLEFIYPVKYTLFAKKK